MFRNSTQNISEDEAANQAQKYAGKVNEDTVSDLVDKEGKITSLFEKAEVLKKYWDDACEVFSLIKDRINGIYTDTPWPTIASLAGALLYVFSPIDCIPDFIPIAGFLDDASVFGLVLMSANVDLMKYRAWKAKHDMISEVGLGEQKVAGLLPATASVEEEKGTIDADIAPEETPKRKLTGSVMAKRLTEKAPPMDASDDFLNFVKSTENCDIDDALLLAVAESKKNVPASKKSAQIDSGASLCSNSNKKTDVSVPAPASACLSQESQAEEWKVPLNKIREVVLAVKAKYDCSDIYLPESQKFSQKWKNMQGVIREKLH